MKGWGTLRSMFNYEDCDQSAKILGLAYFIHSAYFLTTFVLTLHDAIRVVMMTFYLLLCLSVLWQTRKSLKSLTLAYEFSAEILP